MSGRCCSDAAFQPCVFKARLKMKTKQTKLQAIKFKTGRKINSLHYFLNVEVNQLKREEEKLIKALTNPGDHGLVTSSAADFVCEPGQVNPSPPWFATCQMKNNASFSYPVILAHIVPQMKSICQNTYL